MAFAALSWVLDVKMFHKNRNAQNFLVTERSYIPKYAKLLDRENQNIKTFCLDTHTRGPEFKTNRKKSEIFTYLQGNFGKLLANVLNLRSPSSFDIPLSGCMVDLPLNTARIRLKKEQLCTAIEKFRAKMIKSTLSLDLVETKFFLIIGAKWTIQKQRICATWNPLWSATGCAWTCSHSAQ